MHAGMDWAIEERELTDGSKVYDVVEAGVRLLAISKKHADKVKAALDAGVVNVEIDPTAEGAEVVTL